MNQKTFYTTLLLSHILCGNLLASNLKIIDEPNKETHKRSGYISDVPILITDFILEQTPKKNSTKCAFMAEGKHNPRVYIGSSVVCETLKLLPIRPKSIFIVGYYKYTHKKTGKETYWAHRVGTSFLP